MPNRQKNIIINTETNTHQDNIKIFIFNNIKPVQYFFLLGNNYNLAAVEVYTVLQSFKIRYTTILEEAPILIIDSPSEINLPEIQNILGGSIKCGLILNSFEQKNQQKLADFIHETLSTYHPQLHFGINVFDKNENNQNNQLKFWKKWALAWKKENKNNYQHLRFVESNEGNLSSVIIKKNKLLGEHGCDLNLIYNQEIIFIGQSQSVQDFELYSQLDYGRPAYEAKVGMLPPKLAQTMINLSRQSDEDIHSLHLLDPFCGSGTVLNQAVFSGFIHIYGTDIDPQAIQRSKENLSYVSQLLGTVDIDLNLQTIDVNKLSTMLTKANIDKVISEAHLGPALSGKESKGQLNENKRLLEIIYKGAFQEIYKVMKPGGILVLTIPIFLYKQQLIKFDIQNLIYNNFKKAKVLGKHKNLYTDRNSLIYKRPNQKLWREIFVFQKQK